MTISFALPQAFAAPRSCQDVFKTPARVVMGEIVERASAVRKKFTVIQQKLSFSRFLYMVNTPKVEFHAAEFELHKRRFLAQAAAGEVPTLDGFKSPEEFLAFLEANSQWQGQDLLSFFAWKENHWPSFARFLNNISKHDLSKGISISTIEGWIHAAYFSVHTLDFLEFQDIKDKDTQKKMEQLVRLRSEYEVARSGVIQSLKEIGLVKNQNILEKAARTLKNSPGVQVFTTAVFKLPFYAFANVPLAGGIAVQTVLPIIPLPQPDLLKLKAPRLSEALIDKMLFEGWEATKPLAMKELGFAARWDNGLHFLRKGFLAFGIVAQAFFIPMVFSSVHQLNVTSTGEGYIEFVYPKLSAGFATAPLNIPAIGKVAQIPYPKDWGSFRMPMNHIYIDNPMYLLKPQYGENKKAIDNFYDYAQNYFEKCGQSCSLDYQMNFFKAFYDDMPQIMGKKNTNLVELTRAALVFNSQVVSTDEFDSQYDNARATVFRVSSVMNEFDRRDLAQKIGFQIGKPYVLPSQRTVNP